MSRIEEALFATRPHVGGINYHVVIFQEGITIHLRPGKGRLVRWSEIARIADGPAADRYGVVINGRLVAIFDEEPEELDRAANHRQIGMDARVIRVPVTLPG